MWQVFERDGVPKKEGLYVCMMTQEGTYIPTFGVMVWHPEEENWTTVLPQPHLVDAIGVIAYHPIDDMTFVSEMAGMRPN